DARERRDNAMALRLREDALARADEYDGALRVGGARRHVARVLLVTGRDSNYEGAARRRKIAVGNVNRDALFALGLEPVDEQGEVDVPARRAVAARIPLQRLELILENGTRLVEQPPDQRRLAVVDRAACEEAQKAALRSGRGRRGTGERGDGLHQKYPSRFLRSMDTWSSRSMTRPSRSEAREAIN